MGVRSRYLSLRQAALAALICCGPLSLHALDGTEAFLDDPLPPSPTPVKVDTSPAPAPVETNTQVAQRPISKGPAWTVAREEGDLPQVSKGPKSTANSDLPPVPPDGTAPGTTIVLKSNDPLSVAGGNAALAEVIKAEDDARRAKTPIAPDELTKRYQAVLDSDRDNAEAHYRLGVSLMKQLQYKDGMQELAKSVLLKPNNGRYRCGLGRAAVQVGDLPLAAEACQQAVRCDPGSPFYRNALGNVYMRAGGFENLKRAAVAFGEAVQIEPNNPRYLHNLARALSVGGSHERALEVMNEVINVDPESAEAYNDRATLYQTLGDLPKALSDFKTAVRLDPEYVQGMVNLSLLYSNDKTPTMMNKQAALDYAESAVRLTERKNPICLMTLAEAHRANRHLDDAIKVAKEAISIDPSKEYLDRLAKYERIKTMPINSEKTTIIKINKEK